LGPEELAVAKGLMRDWPPLFMAMTSHRTHRNEPLNFADYPYIRQIYADRSQHMGSMKSTQSGLSEYALCRELSLALSGRNQFHVLPQDRLIGRYVRERFDKAVSFTRRYRSAVRDSGGADNVTLKQVGPGTVAFVGSNSPASFAEFPADDGIVDEYDRCDQRNVLMVEDRLANSRHRTTLIISQPSITDFGIHRMWKASKMWTWHVRCGCGEWVHPSFLDHAVVQEGEGVWTYADRDWEPGSGEPRLMHSCGREVPCRAEGEWVARNPGAEPSFYHIGKEFSTRVPLSEMAAAFSRGLDDDAAMMRFYNSDLGLPYTPKGSKVTSSDLDSCVQQYVMPQSCQGPCVAGVDVGSTLHVRINEILPDGSERAVFIGGVRDEPDLFELLGRYRVVAGVIDAMPEIRLSRRVSKLRGWLRCEFHSSRSADRVDPEQRKVTVNRTEILDATVARLRERRVALPRNAASLPEYYGHMQALTRVFNEARQEYEWIGDAPDHLLLAEAYCTLARRVVAAMS